MLARFLSVSRWPSSSRTGPDVADCLVCVSSAICFRNTGAAWREPSSDGVTAGDPAASPGGCARARHLPEKLRTTVVVVSVETLKVAHVHPDEHR